MLKRMSFNLHARPETMHATDLNFAIFHHWYCFILMLCFPALQLIEVSQSLDIITESQVSSKNISKRVCGPDVCPGLSTGRLHPIHFFGYIAPKNWCTAVPKWGVGVDSAGTKPFYKVPRVCLLKLGRGMVTAYLDASQLNIFIKEMQDGDSVVSDTSSHRYTSVLTVHLTSNESCVFPRAQSNQELSHHRTSLLVRDFRDSGIIRRSPRDNQCLYYVAPAPDSLIRVQKYASVIL
jgi:hypothetical protein